MKEKLAGISALVAAAIASVCCIGPVVLLGLGLGGAGLATSLTEYRPFFIGLTTIFLGLAFYFTYRKKQVECPDGSCEFKSGSRSMKIFLWAVIFVVIGMISFPHWFPPLMAKGQVAIPDNAQLISMEISGMTCSACSVSIEESLIKLSGVHSASVSIKDQKAEIYVSPDKVNNEILIQAVQDAGPYSVVIQEVKQ